MHNIKVAGAAALHPSGAAADLADNDRATLRPRLRDTGASESDVRKYHAIYDTR